MYARNEAKTATINVEETSEMNTFFEQLCKAVPSKRQLDWYDMGFYAFIHFGVNTFTDREWGEGDEPEQIFNPEKLDCDQWVNAIKSAGMKGMILTAKHHDGFCLWPSKYTEHSVKNSPCTKDIVREASEACKRGGIKFGFYLSPWDRNCELYGTDEYNDYFCNQLTELLTEYGDIFCVWFDGACGEGPNGKKQVYDFDRYIELIRKYQPNAVIFNDHGPDVRWCGNEAGKARESEWAVIPSELCFRSEVQTGPGPLADIGALSCMYNSNQRVGTLDMVLYSKGLTFTPAEVDTSIRKGWFWHKEEDPRSVDDLFEVYKTTVGGNCCLNLNIPPNRDGLLDERDVKRLKELGDKINEHFGKEIPSSLVKKDTGNIAQEEFEITIGDTMSDVRYVVIEEDLTKGQRIESFHLLNENEPLFPVYYGGAVGNRRICEIYDSSTGQNPLLFADGKKAGKLILRIMSSRGRVNLKSVKLY